MRSTFFAVKPSDHQNMNEVIENFITKLKNKYASESISDAELFRSNIQAYSLKED